MNLQSISRYISLILRHKPEVINITLNEHGWANVEELIQGIAKNNPGFNKEILEEIVRTDNKQRYSFNDFINHFPISSSSSTTNLIRKCY